MSEALAAWDGYAYDVGSDPRGSKPTSSVSMRTVMSEFPLEVRVSGREGDSRLRKRTELDVAANPSFRGV